MEESRLASLIDLYIAGVLNAGEKAELRQWLISSPEARAQFERHISWYEITNPGTRLFSASEFLRQCDADTEGTDERRSPWSMRQLFQTAFYTWRGGIAVSGVGAILVCAILITFSNRVAPLPPFDPPVHRNEGIVATIRQAAGVKWLSATGEVFSGDTLPAGHLRIAAGALQLEFKRGARLILEAPADLELISDNEAFLHSGKVTALVPDSAHGFKVTAPAVAVMDLGTEFGLLARSNAPAEVHVFSGMVMIAQRTATPQRLVQGQAARLHSRRVKTIVADPEHFLFEEELGERVIAEQRDRHQQWKEAARHLSQDPAAVVHYTFEDHSDTARELANFGFGAPAQTVGTIAGCTWTTGRWPEKRGLAFGARGDRVRFSVPNTLTSLTYMAWLRIDNLVNLSNALAVTETMQLGEVHWQVYRDGRVALSARSGNGATVDQSWDRGISPPIFTPERLGQWTQLVSVYDSSAQNIRHYVNGEFISSTSIKRPVALKLGAVEIGNWGVRVDQPKWASMKNSGPAYLQRHWTGCIDEFALLTRALSADEIRRYYSQGRVSLGVVLAQAQ